MRSPGDEESPEDEQEDNEIKGNNFSLRNGWSKLSENEKIILSRDAHRDDDKPKTFRTEDVQEDNETEVKNVAHREFFKLGNIKDRAVKHIDKTVLHESRNIEKILDAALSAFTADPINLVVEAGPSEGKTFLIINALRVFPEEYVETYRDASPKSFTREKGQLALRVIQHEEKSYITATRNRFTDEEQSITQYLLWLKKESKDDKSSHDLKEIAKELDSLRKDLITLIDLKHRVIVFLDRPQPELWKSLLSVLSHDTYYTESMFVEGIGLLHTKHIVFRGWPAFIFATTKDEPLDFHDLESRFEVVEPIMSPEKYTDAISAKLNKVYGTEKPDNGELKEIRGDVKRLIDRILDPDKALVTMAPIKPEKVFKILFNADTQEIGSGDMMRKIPRLVSHIALNCLWHYNERVALVGPDERIIWAAEDLKSILREYEEIEINALLAGFPVSYYEFLTKILVPAFYDLEDEEHKKDRVPLKTIRKTLEDYVTANGTTHLKSDKMALSRYLGFLDVDGGRGLIEKETDKEDKRKKWISLIGGADNSLISIDDKIEKIGTLSKTLAHEHIGALLNENYRAYQKGLKISTQSPESIRVEEESESANVPEMMDNSIRLVDSILTLSGYGSILPDILVPNFDKNKDTRRNEENTASPVNSEISESQKSAPIQGVPIIFSVPLWDKVTTFYYVGKKETYQLSQGSVEDILGLYQLELLPEDIITLPGSFAKSLQELGLGEVLDGGSQE